MPRFPSPRRSREFTGRLDVHRDGYAFFIPDSEIEGVEGDVFIARESAARAMHGDHVAIRLLRIEPGGRAAGEILRVLSRAHPTVVGEFRVQRRGNCVVPHDERIRQWILIPDGLEVPPRPVAADRIGAAPAPAATPDELDGQIVNVEILEFPEGRDAPVGRVFEILGHPDDFGVDVEIVIRKHHLPHRFPPEAAEQARRIPAAIHPDELAGRRDFRGLDAVTIDGETARDFDDAVWVGPLAGGNFALHVHIADVSHYVRPGTPIDQEARLRGSSVYFPDRAVPMLPLELSTDICSLLPGVDRLVVSALLEIDRQGDIVAQEFTRGVIHSAGRMTYTAVHQLLEGGQDERFERMRELALILNRKRVRRGAIDFDLPEPLIEFDQWGEMTGVTRSPRNIAHRIIEEFMLAANEAVASHLERTLAASIFRIHEVPDPQRVAEFEEIAARFGHSLGFGALAAKRFPMVDRKRDGRKVRKDLIRVDERLAVSSRQYQKLVARIEGRPEERVLSYLMLRSLKQARYSEENRGHFALASPCYTHFTSPIRRYPDLVVHRLLKASLDGRAGLERAALRSIAEESSDSERRAAEAERELVEWKKLKFMAARLGDEFVALITSVAKFGFFVELEELFVEGLVPIDTLAGDRFGFQETTRQIVGQRTRRKFSIGDRVQVRLDRVDAVERKLQFSLPDLVARKKRS